MESPSFTPRQIPLLPSSSSSPAPGGGGTGGCGVHTPEPRGDPCCHSSDSKKMKTSPPSSSSSSLASYFSSLCHVEISYELVLFPLPSSTDEALQKRQSKLDTFLSTTTSSKETCTKQGGDGNSLSPTTASASLQGVNQSAPRGVPSERKDDLPFLPPSSNSSSSSSSSQASKSDSCSNPKTTLPTDLGPSDFRSSVLAPSSSSCKPAHPVVDSALLPIYGGALHPYTRTYDPATSQYLLGVNEEISTSVELSINTRRRLASTPRANSSERPTPSSLSFTSPSSSSTGKKGDPTTTTSMFPSLRVLLPSTSMGGGEEEDEEKNNKKNEKLAGSDLLQREEGNYLEGGVRSSPYSSSSSSLAMTQEEDKKARRCREKSREEMYRKETKVCGEVFLGRKKRSLIRLKNQAVSGVHCHISWCIDTSKLLQLTELLIQTTPSFFSPSSSPPPFLLHKHRLLFPLSSSQISPSSSSFSQSDEVSPSHHASVKSRILTPSSSSLPVHDNSTEERKRSSSSYPFRFRLPSQRSGSLLYIDAEDVELFSSSLDRATSLQSSKERKDEEDERRSFLVSSFSRPGLTDVLTRTSLRNRLLLFSKYTKETHHSQGGDEEEEDKEIDTTHTHEEEEEREEKKKMILKKNRTENRGDPAISPHPSMNGDTSLLHSQENEEKDTRGKDPHKTAFPDSLQDLTPDISLLLSPSSSSLQSSQKEGQCGAVHLSVKDVSTNGSWIAKRKLANAKTSLWPSSAVLALSKSYSSTDPPVAAFRWALAVRWRVMNERSDEHVDEEEEKKKNETSTAGEKANERYHPSLSRGEGGVKILPEREDDKGTLEEEGQRDCKEVSSSSSQELLDLPLTSFPSHETSSVMDPSKASTIVPSKPQTSMHSSHHRPHETPEGGEQGEEEKENKRNDVNALQPSNHTPSPMNLSRQARSPREEEESERESERRIPSTSKLLSCTEGGVNKRDTVGEEEERRAKVMKEHEEISSQAEERRKTESRNEERKEAAEEDKKSEKSFQFEDTDKQKSQQQRNQKEEEGETGVYRQRRGNSPDVASSCLSSSERNASREERHVERQQLGPSSHQKGDESSLSFSSSSFASSSTVMERQGELFSTRSREDREKEKEEDDGSIRKRERRQDGENRCIREKEKEEQNTKRMKASTLNEDSRPSVGDSSTAASSFSSTTSSSSSSLSRVSSEENEARRSVDGLISRPKGVGREAGDQRKEAEDDEEEEVERKNGRTCDTSDTTRRRSLERGSHNFPAGSLPLTPSSASEGGPRNPPHLQHLRQTVGGGGGSGRLAQQLKKIMEEKRSLEDEVQQLLLENEELRFLHQVKQEEESLALERMKEQQEKDLKEARQMIEGLEKEVAELARKERKLQEERVEYMKTAQETIDALQHRELELQVSLREACRERDEKKKEISSLLQTLEEERKGLIECISSFCSSLNSRLLHAFPPFKISSSSASLSLSSSPSLPLSKEGEEDDASRLHTSMMSETLLQASATRGGGISARKRKIEELKSSSHNDNREEEEDLSPRKVSSSSCRPEENKEEGRGGGEKEEREGEEEQREVNSSSMIAAIMNEEVEDHGGGGTRKLPKKKKIEEKEEKSSETKEFKENEEEEERDKKFHLGRDLLGGATIEIHSRSHSLERAVLSRKETEMKEKKSGDVSSVLSKDEEERRKALHKEDAPLVIQSSRIHHKHHDKDSAKEKKSNSDRPQTMEDSLPLLSSSSDLDHISPSSYPSPLPPSSSRTPCTPSVEHGERKKILSHEDSSSPLSGEGERYQATSTTFSSSCCVSRTERGEKSTMAIDEKPTKAKHLLGHRRYHTNLNSIPPMDLYDRDQAPSGQKKDFCFSSSSSSPPSTSTSLEKNVSDKMQLLDQRHSLLPSVSSSSASVALSSSSSVAYEKFRKIEEEERREREKKFQRLDRQDELIKKHKMTLPSRDQDKEEKEEERQASRREEQRYNHMLYQDQIEGRERFLHLMKDRRGDLQGGSSEGLSHSEIKDSDRLITTNRSQSQTKISSSSSSSSSCSNPASSSLSSESNQSHHQTSLLNDDILSFLE
ncbi:hypothetical protein CSUI_006676 [Cystoisospora suis]|uniref:Uncharacterized protein n=1 Tax=Cystoisospora suis TaxID=483139 RepID=A0A2C6KTK1_9APIC|nr:hypothetical protein CSUI_006676 [Cystoisospora suis]